MAMEQWKTLCMIFLCKVRATTRLYWHPGTPFCEQVVPRLYHADPNPPPPHTHTYSTTKITASNNCWLWEGQNNILSSLQCPKRYPSTNSYVSILSHVPPVVAPAPPQLLSSRLRIALNELTSLEGLQGLGALEAARAD